MLTKGKTGAEGKPVTPAECSSIRVAVTAVNFTSCLQVVMLNPMPKCSECWQELATKSLLWCYRACWQGEERIQQTALPQLYQLGAFSF